MPVRRRPNGSWLIDIWHEAAPGGRFRKTVPGDLGKREAQALERKYRADLDEGLASTRRAPTVNQALDRYWQEHGQHLASAGTERGYLNAWADALGDDADVTRIGADAVATAVARWRGTVSDSTINRRLSCLQRIWGRAEDFWGWRLARIPWRRLRLHEPQHGDQSIRPAERERFLAALPRRTALVFHFALLTGLRRGGILMIEAKHIDRDGGVIHTWSKGRAGGKHTPIPITAEVAAFLAELGPPEVGRLFPVTPAELRRDIAKARKATGLAHVQLRKTRHSFAQDLEDAGQGEAITHLLHHSDPKLRDRYAKVRMNRLRDVLEKVQAAKKLSRDADDGTS